MYETNFEKIGFLVCYGDKYIKKNHKHTFLLAFPTKESFNEFDCFNISVFSLRIFYAVIEHKYQCL